MELLNSSFDYWNDSEPIDWDVTLYSDPNCYVYIYDGSPRPDSSGNASVQIWLKGYVDGGMFSGSATFSQNISVIAGNTVDISGYIEGSGDVYFFVSFEFFNDNDFLTGLLLYNAPSPSSWQLVSNTTIAPPGTTKGRLGIFCITSVDDLNIYCWVDDFLVSQTVNELNTAFSIVFLGTSVLLILVLAQKNKYKF